MVLSFPFPFPCAWLRCHWLRVLSNGHVAAHLRLLSCCVWLHILDRLLLLLLLLLLCLGWLRVVVRLQLLLLQCSHKAVRLRVDVPRPTPASSSHRAHNARPTLHDVASRDVGGSVGSRSPGPPIL